MAACCISGKLWEGTPQGTETTLGNNKCYVTGSNPDIAIMVVHDLLGWTLNNTRLLADVYAEEVGATVYVPDFYGGEVLSPTVLDDPEFFAKDLPAFEARNPKSVRGPEIVAAGKLLRSKYRRVGAIGYCFGGWGVLHLAKEGHDAVDCVSAAHPSLLTEEEIASVAVPVQIMAPQHDPMFTEELKASANKIIPTRGVAYDYQYFPGMGHGFAIRTDKQDPSGLKAATRAKNAAVCWFKSWLHDDTE